MIIGLDVGGTNIDIVLINDNEVIKKNKYPIDILSESIKSSLSLFLDEVDSTLITQVNLSTTITTNLLANNYEKDIGLILQVGPGLIEDKYKIGKYTRFISGYTDHQGIIVKEYLEEELDEIINYFINNNIDDVSIITKFSNRNHIIEEKIKNKLKKHFSNVKTGHELSSALNFKRRINTTYLNTLLYKEFSSFLNMIKKQLDCRNINVPIYILKADGGTMSLKEAYNKPIESVLSGPAASLQGINYFFDIKEDSILLDIGGTTTDIFIYSNDNYLFEPYGAEINNYKTNVKSVFSKSYSIGGDTTIIIENNKIKFTNQRLDKPYSLGGKYLTLTDCLIFLGKTNIGDFKRANKIIKDYSNILKMDPVEFSNKVLVEFLKYLEYAINETLEIVNSKIVYTIKELLGSIKIKPKNIYGIGPTFEILSEEISTLTNLNVYYPDEYLVANAIGSGMSNITKELTLYIDSQLNKLSIPQYNIFEDFYKNISLAKGIILAKNYLINLNKDLNIKEEDIYVSESEIFNKIDYGKKDGVRISVKVSILPSLKFRSKNYE